MAILFATTETVSATSPTVDVGGRTLSVLALRTAAFGGLIEIQGQINSDSDWHLVRYFISNPDELELTGPFNTAIGPPPTGERHYYVSGPWRRLRVKKAHTRGTIEVDHFASPVNLFTSAADGSSAAAALTQSDPDALQVAANLKLGLDDVGDLNPIPISVVDIGGIKEELRRLEPPDRLHYVTVTIPGIAAADAFDANDAVGIVFAIPVPKRGTIETAKLIDPDDDTLALTAHLYNRLFVGAASDAAYTVAAGYAPFWVTAITFDTPIVDEGGFKGAEKQGATDYEAPEGFLWCQCSTTGTPNIAAGAMPILQFGIRVRA